jgi:hypothetical protein
MGRLISVEGWLRAYKTTRCHSTEDQDGCLHEHENLRSQIIGNYVVSFSLLLMNTAVLCAFRFLSLGGEYSILHNSNLGTYTSQL